MIKAPVFVFIKLFPSSDILRKNGFQIVANMHSHILLLFICNHRHTYNHIHAFKAIVVYTVCSYRHI